MKMFLRLKHWQLFCLLIGIPVIFQIFMTWTMITTQNPQNFLLLFPVMMILFMGLFFSWFYTLGTSLHKKLPDTVKLSLTKFKIFLSVPVTYLLFISIFMASVIGQAFSGQEPNPAIFAIIVPVHLFSIFCIFYCLYFIAKSLKAVELQRPVTANDFIGEFFMIWFFPIGIWIIQPRINKIFGAQAATQTENALDQDL